MTNPLMTKWDTPFGVPPFAQIADDDFAPALEQALKTCQDAIDAVTNTPRAPSFENTLAALERATQPLGKVTAPFYALLASVATPEREALARDFAPKLAAFDSALKGNTALFARIEAVWDDRDQLDLSFEQMRLLEQTREAFVRGGALLEGEDAADLRGVMARLSELGTRFTQNVTEAERAWAMELSPEALAALPAFVQSTARAAGEARGSGPVVTLSRSLIVPFLQFSPDRALREKAYLAWCNRGAATGEDDNRAIAAETLALRAERAKLLGFDSFAAYKLDAQMAKTPDAVRDLLMQVWSPARKSADHDAQILEKMLHTDGYGGPLEPWDWRYYSERRRLVEHDLDEAEIMPYFQLDRMIEAAFDTAHRLFNLEFQPVEVPSWHPDCRAWEVTREGKHVALFIGDYFARAGKRSGAWCSNLQPQHKLDGDQRPIVLNNCSFAKSDPALISFDDAETLFHEFGHALHYFLSDVTYPSLSGLNVERDFVELPSQLFEHWLSQPDVLDQYATHVETGAPIPADLRDRVLAASTYDAGFNTVEYLASAIVDLDFHDGPAPADPMQKQAETLERIGMPHAISMRHATPHFAHVFAGDGYSCGYYSYMWSEVMDADAFDAFTDTGDAFDPETAQRLEAEILSRGATRPARDHYTAFRGRMPGVEPLLRARGLSTDT